MSDKTEAPTAQRLSEAREKGQIAKSVEVNTALLILAVFWLLRGAMQRMGEHLQTLTKSVFGTLTMDALSIAAVGNLATRTVTDLFIAGAPFLLGMIAVALAANLAQTRGLFAPTLLKPDVNRINPLKGLQRLFSQQGAVQLAKALLKVALIGWVAFGFLRGEIQAILAPSPRSLTQALLVIAETALALGVRVGAVYLLLAALDFGYQYRQWRRGLRMTKQELKEELKRSEGDPLLRQRVRQQQRQIARQRMLEQVPTASVVLTNPTHLAVALRYDRATMAAPTVIAKGARLIAERIIATAREHAVPVIENKPLARAIYTSVELNQQIPSDLYQSVAEILAFVLGLNSRK